MVAGDDLALFVYAQAPVGITVVGKAYIQAVFDDEALETLDVGGTGVVVDIEAIGLGIDCLLYTSPSPRDW